MQRKIVLILLISISAFTTTFAQKAAKQRVKHGVKTGGITKKEAVKIREERKDVKSEIKEAKADGIVTKEEAKDIKEERIEANEVIRRSKHNSKVRK